MTRETRKDDIRTIKVIINRTLDSVRWSPHKVPDWAAFENDFLPGAFLIGTARPVKNQTARDLIPRFQSLARSGHGSFEQSALRSEIQVFGTVAIAFGVCRNLENRTVEVRGVEAFLLVKEEGACKIAAQAWDTETETAAIPDYMLD